MQECSQKIVVIKMYSKETWEIMFKENLIFQFSWLEEFRKENISEWRTLDKLQCKNSLSFTLMVLNNYWIKGCPFFFFFFFFELFIFCCNSLTSIESVLMKTMTDYSKNILQPLFCFHLALLHISEKKHWKLQFCWYRTSWSSFVDLMK